MRKRTASVTVCFILLVSCFMTVKADGPAIEPYSSTIFSNYIASATCPSAGKITGSIYVAIRDDGGTQIYEAAIQKRRWHLDDGKNLSAGLFHGMQ